MAKAEEPVRVAVANDYQIIVAGLAELLGHFPDRVTVVEQVLVGELLDENAIDVLLYDTYGRTGIVDESIALLRDPRVERLAVFSLDLNQHLVDDALAAGATGFISKALSGDEIADALVRVASGEVVFALGPEQSAAGDDDDQVESELDWPGRGDGLTQRESQVLVLVAEGLTNAEAAEALYLNVETVKTHVGNLLSKLEARNRVQLTGYAHRTAGFARHRSSDRRV